MSTPAPDPEQSRANRPEVAVNFALTWDGRISTRNHTPSDFSSPHDKRRLLEIRATGDAVLAGAATIAADRMTMGLPVQELRDSRIARGQNEYPLRVLLTNSGRVDSSLPIFQHAFSPIHIFSTGQMPAEYQKSLGKVAELHLDDAEKVSLRGMLELLSRDFAVERLICEGGSQVFRSLLVAGLVDELNVTFCPRVFGGEQAPSLTGPAGSFLPESVRCQLEKHEMIEGECFARYRVLR